MNYGRFVMSTEPTLSIARFVVRLRLPTLNLDDMTSPLAFAQSSLNTFLLSLLTTTLRFFKKLPQLGHSLCCLHHICCWFIGMAVTLALSCQHRGLRMNLRFCAKSETTECRKENLAMLSTPHRHAPATVF